MSRVQQRWSAVSAVVACLMCPAWAQAAPAANPAMWWRADAGALNSSGLPAANGEQVQTWQDQSAVLGLSHVSQDSVPRRPEYVSNGINGLPSISFENFRMGDINGESESFTSPIDPMTANGPRTVFEVAKAIDNGTDLVGGSFLSFRSAPNWYHSRSQILSYAGPNREFVFSDSLTGNATVVANRSRIESAFVGALATTGDGTPEFAGTPIGVATSYFNGGQDVIDEAWQGGSTVRSNSSGADVGIRVAGRPDGTDNNWAGLISEMIVYDRVLNAAELNETGYYLAQKYGITTSYVSPTLPGDVNFDGVVNIFDINLVSSHWGETGPVADANNDMIVNIFDINLISSNWSPPPGGGAAVPEPSTCWLLGLGGLGLAVVTVCRRKTASRGTHAPRTTA